MNSPEPAEPTDNSPRKGAVLLALRYYVKELSRQRAVAVPALLLPAVGNAALNFVSPLIVAMLAGRIADGLKDGHDGVTAADCAPYLLAYAGTMLAAEALWRIGLHCINRTEARGIERLYRIGMDELFAKDSAFFHDNFAGALTKRVISFASRFEPFADSLIFQILGNLVPLAFASVVLARYNPLLVVVLLSMLALTAFCVTPLIRRRQRLVRRREEAITRVSGHIADVVGNMDTIIAFAAHRREAAEHHDRIGEARDTTIASWDYGNLRVDTVIAPMSVLTGTLGLLVALLLGKGRHSVEEIVVVFTYFTNGTRIMYDFNRIYRQMESTLTEAAQFTELLLKPPAVTDPEHPEPLRPGPAHIRFDKVVFAHRGAGDRLFDGLDLDLRAGTRTGLVGRSGSGKTTLARLLLRMSDVDGGRILVGGQDISRLRREDLRGLISYVPQEPPMFHRTLRDNIAFARPGATDAEIRRAAEAAHVDEFADSLPLGFETLVGERGIKLSGGQRQRVALARAILRDAPILLLDEATSALDSESEVLVQEALWRLMENRTALVVAHRLSTVAGMDRLVVLDRGRVVEQGTHDELLAASGTYARLWTHQSGGFLGEPGEPAEAGGPGEPAEAGGPGEPTETEPGRLGALGEPSGAAEPAAARSS